MSDLKSEIGSDIDQNYSLNNTADPKNVQELTIYVSNSTRWEFHICAQLFNYVHKGSNGSFRRLNRYKIYCKTYKTNSNRCLTK